MLKEFKVRFFDAKLHKHGFISILSALNKNQAIHFAEQILFQLSDDYDDWDRQTIEFEIM